jgi:hypothetical protein
MRMARLLHRKERAAERGRSVLGYPMTNNFERLLEPGSIDLPECRCGNEMHFANVVFPPNETTTHVRVYVCGACEHQMRLTVWGHPLETGAATAS